MRSASGTSTVSTRLALCSLRRVDHLDRLGAERASQDRVVPRAQRRFVDVELVGIHGALDDGLAETVGRGDEHDVAKAGIGVEREHHAARAEVTAHHVLDAGRQRDLRVIETLVHAVRDRAIVEQRREDLVHGLDDLPGAAHVQQRFLLSRERGLGQVFGGGGGAHGDGDIGAGHRSCARSLRRSPAAVAQGTASPASSRGSARRSRRGARRHRRRGWRVPA